MKTLETRAVTKIFKSGSTEVRALTDISLSFEAGELTVVMGPSGSGKTTLLSILGCVLSPTSGDITILGQKVNGLSEKERRRLRLGKIGFIFQDFNLLDALTVRENVAMANQLRGDSRAAGLKNSEKLLTDVGLCHRLDFLPKDLSQGEKQRVAIARAFMNDPNIIIADEPTANLDSRTGQDIIAKIGELGENKTTIIATHDERITQLADRVVRIEDGRAVEMS
ncbi:ABC transporter ATP-binding protein [Candidatus Poribacteria bacterium]|nr:ABC transporter ATP-binding protein [Candidatus Poribacteria bacterium]